MTNVIDEINAVRERNREDYKALARMTGKTIAEIEADTTAPDPREETVPHLENLNKLSDNMSVEFSDDNIVLYDTRACSVKRIAAMTLREMLALTALFTDGWCPVCLAEEIALHDIVCDECLENARNMRRLAR